MTTATDIAAAIESSEWEYESYGLRICSDDLAVGADLGPSRRWVDGEPTAEYLGGTSVIEIDPSDVGSIERALALAGTPGSARYYPGTRLYLVGGSVVERGEDDGEALLDAPEVIAVWDR